MTDEEKKEFEEFLEWKKKKKEEEQPSSPSVDESKEPSSSNVNKSSEKQANSEQSGKAGKSESQSLNIAIILGVFALIIFVIIFVVSLSSVNNTSNNGKSAITADSSSVLEEESKEEPTGWTRSVEKDPMDDSDRIFVSVSSDNFNNIGEPYGVVNVTLMVRKMKKYGTDVIVQTSSGQIFGNKYNDTNYITVRFDNNKPMRFYFDEAADGSSGYVFLRKRSAFIANAKKAHKITIDVPYFQAGRQVFTFTTPKPLEWQ